jgi:hypothetical protein
MQEPIASAKTPSGRRRAKLLAGTLALTMASFGAAVGISAAPAFADFTSNNYTIGTPGSAFTAVSATPTAATSGSSQSYVITATAPSAIPNGDDVTVTDSAGNVPVSAATAVSLVDENAANCLQSGTNGGAESTTGGLVIVLDSTCNIAAGDTLKIGLTVTDPGSNFYFIVASTVNGTTVDSNTVTINAVPPTVTPSPVTVGYGATYTIAGIGASTLSTSGPAWTTSDLTGTASTIESTTSLIVTSVLTPTSNTVPTTSNSIGWYASSNGAGYSVTYTPSGGSLTTDTVDSATVDPCLSVATFCAVPPATGAGDTNNQVLVQLASGITPGSTITLNAEGLNPSVDSSYTVDITPQWTNPPTSVPTVALQAPYEALLTENGTVTFGTSVTGVTVTPSPTLASTSASYTVGFKAGSAVASGGYICLAEPNTSFANAVPSTAVTSASLAALVTDTTSGAQFVVSPNTVTLGDGATDVTCGTSTLNTHSLQVVLPSTNSINAGDQITVTVINVTSPAVGTYSDFAVSTSSDKVVVDAPAYQIGVSSNAGVNVVVSPTTPGSLATYTISGEHASSAIQGGAAIYITVPPGTVLPDNGADYTLTDSTTTTGSGGLTLLDYLSDTHVELTVPNAINSGDMLTITVDGVINPPLSGSYSLTVSNADFAAPAVTAPVFPEANTAYPDAGLVNFSGTIYLFAGGHAFGIPTPAVLASVQVNDHATVVSAPTGATVPNATPAVGTVIFTYNNPTIYVVGTDGDLHGFATPAQFLGDGYDPADVITVPNLNGLTVGATGGSEGTAVTALATSANGAIVDSSGTYYVFAGGKAFGIPTPARLAAVQAGDTATPLSGTVTAAQTGATIRSGTVVTLNSAVWVANAGALYAFKSVAQLQADGYGGTPSIVIPNVGGISAVSTYTGS